MFSVCQVPRSRISCTQTLYQREGSHKTVAIPPQHWHVVKKHKHVHSASKVRLRIVDLYITKIDDLGVISLLSYRYINDFSKALASEVRILLAEVGKLRDERRALQ